MTLAHIRPRHVGAHVSLSGVNQHQSASISINQHQPESISTNRHQSAPISINQHQPALLIGCWLILISAERCQRVTQVWAHPRPFSIYVKISQDWQKEKSSNHQKFLWILSPVFEKWFIAYITLVGFHGFGLTYKWRHLSIYGRHASNWCALCKPIDEHQCNACWWTPDR